MLIYELLNDSKRLGVSATSLYFYDPLIYGRDTPPIIFLEENWCAFIPIIELIPP